MQPFKGYIYGLINQRGTIKIGCTQYPVHRLRVYTTGDAPGDEKHYVGIWLTTASAFYELRTMEQRTHFNFGGSRMKRHTGQLTEWFKVTIDSLSEWLNSQKFISRQLTSDEIEHIRHESLTDSTSESKKLLDLEDELFSYGNRLDEFIQYFLPAGSLLRRVQTELWFKFKDICESELSQYRGVIQWPTGVGKSIALCMLVILASDKCKDAGSTYRGLLVIPKLDIIASLGKYFDILHKFGITIYDGSRGNLSKLTIPLNQHVLIVTTHQSLTDETAMNRFPPIYHTHYDEVHRISGDVFMGHLTRKLDEWKTPFLTGTSATPLTGNIEQMKKVTELFGDPLPILHRCNMDEAILEGWIAPPKYCVSILEKGERGSVIKSFVHEVDNTINKKKSLGKWGGGKVIVYITTSTDDVRFAIKYAREVITDAKIYSAIDGERTDEEFVNAPCDGKLQILFVCQRYREGSDVRGVEMCCTLVGDSTAAYIMLQICGRALRNDYANKEGWFLVARPSEEGTTDEDVLASIVLDISSIIGKDGFKNDGERPPTLYLGDMKTADGSLVSIDETVKRVQALYVRREYERRTYKDKYALVRELNKKMRLKSRGEYFASAENHPKYIEAPELYFKTYWTCWYDFLGIDTSVFPTTKAEWKKVCKDRGINSWSEYKDVHGTSLPDNPGELYSDYTNWDTEFGIEPEMVW
jgi:superfamily II DNA or RNA helicase